jgi:sulfite reductase (NADPH) flavoprotein alpha-component
LWLGLSVGLVLTVMALSGALLAFEPQWRKAWSETPSSTDSGPLLSPPELAEQLAAQGIADRVTYISWSDPSTFPATIWTERSDGTIHRYALDPRTGERMPRAEAAYEAYWILLDLHRKLAMGSIGEGIVAWSAVGLLVISVTGLGISVRRWRQWTQIWWPRPRERKTAGIQLRLWHRWIGAWVTPWFFLMALTGMVWAFDGWNALLRGFGGPSKLVEVPTLDAADSIAWDTIWSQALAARGEASGAMRVRWPRSPQQVVQFEWSPAHVPSSAMRSRLFFAPESGAIVATHPYADFTAGEQLVRWAYPLHTGKIAGLPGQMLAFLGALTLPFFFVSGILLYLRRRQKARAVIHPLPS